jgi:hypothetical protein
METNTGSYVKIKDIITNDQANSLVDNLEFVKNYIRTKNGDYVKIKDIVTEDEKAKIVPNLLEDTVFKQFYKSNQKSSYSSNNHIEKLKKYGSLTENSLMELDTVTGYKKNKQGQNTSPDKIIELNNLKIDKKYKYILRNQLGYKDIINYRNTVNAVKANNDYIKALEKYNSQNDKFGLI